MKSTTYLINTFVVCQEPVDKYRIYRFIMGRKGKRHSSRNQKSNPQGKVEISKLLDSRRAHHRETGGEANYDESKLEKQFQPLFEKFQAPEVDGSSNQVVVYYDDAEPGEIPPTVEEVDELDNHSREDRPLSRRKLRKASKPALYELKRSVPYPQVIEWYDRDAQYPYLQASIKSSKNMVQVPSHWQNRKEYLAGRSFLEKRPFELPEIIKETDIEQMRQVMPEDTKDSTLKETSRARVQPKMGTLDVDYKKLHDVFFKLGNNWKPDVLLPFGDLYYEGRNLYEEAQWKKLVRNKKPGKISTELRSIMNLGEGQLPPWCMKMKNAGMPPSYPNLKVAGLNWGIENLKGDTYGTLSTEKDQKEKVKYFGQMMLLDEPEQENIGEEPEEPIEQGTDLKGDQNNSTKPIEAPIEIKRNPVQNENDEDTRPLYTVIEEKRLDAGADTTGSRTVYTLPDNNQETEKSPKQSGTSEQDEKQDHIEQFKF